MTKARMCKQVDGKPDCSESSKSGPAQVVAVIDCGTCAVRATIAQIQDNKVIVLDTVEYPIDLIGGSIGGRLTRRVMDELISAFERITHLASTYGVERFRAVATTVLRTAINRDVFLERVCKTFPFELEVISGPEESRLYYEALRALTNSSAEEYVLSGTDLFMNIGASSTVTCVIGDGLLLHSIDEHIGTSRMLEQFRDFKDSEQFAATVDRFAQGAIRVTMGRLHMVKPTRLFVTGSDVRAYLTYAQRCHGVEYIKEKDFIRVHKESAQRWHESIHRVTHERLSEACGGDTENLEPAQMYPAVGMLCHLCDATGLEEVIVPELTLRDGLLADMCRGVRGPFAISRTSLLSEAREISQRYGMDVAYAEQTRLLASELFDQTKSLHGLGERECTLLECASLLHDVGAYINVHDRHQHSHTIIANSDMAGLSPEEKGIVAQVARYHRGVLPNEGHADYMRMSREHRVLISQLAAIMRIAYSLDVDRIQRIDHVYCSIQQDRLVVRVDRRRIDLERWSLARKADLFREVFGLDVVIVPREEY